jgi:hypothetical protein
MHTGNLDGVTSLNTFSDNDVVSLNQAHMCVQSLVAPLARLTALTPSLHLPLSLGLSALPDILNQ